MGGFTHVSMLGASLSVAILAYTVDVGITPSFADCLTAQLINLLAKNDCSGEHLLNLVKQLISQVITLHFKLIQLILQDGQVLITLSKLVLEAFTDEVLIFRGVLCCKDDIVMVLIESLHHLLHILWTLLHVPIG